MASNKKYSYYLRGNQIALIEEDTGLGSGTCSLSDYKNKAACENAGGTWTESSSSGRDDGKYKSPQSSVSSGLEIEYAYSPRYRTYSNPVVDVNKFYVNGWTVIGGYLAFLRARRSTIVNWSSSPESTVTSGSSGDTGGQTLDYIVVGGSSRWNGLHKVQTAGTEGQLVTYTKVSETLPYCEDQQVDFNTSEEIFDGGAGTLWLADYFSSGDHIFISGSNDEANNGLFSISSVSTSATAASSKLTLGTRYAVVNSADATSYSTGLDNEYSAAAALAAETSQSDINIYKAHRDFAYVLADVDTLNDEADTIDLPEYLTKALVYYVKAQLAEDQGDLEKHLYNRKQFRALMQRHENSRVWGSRRIFPGIGAIR